jgi:hypothetical protein
MAILKLPHWSSVAMKGTTDVRRRRLQRRDEGLATARSLFFHHGYDIAQAAALLGGGAAEARVISCALRLETATRIDARIRRDLVAIHRLLALHDMGDPECLETGYFGDLHPGSAEVETICLLTDLLDDLLRSMGVDTERDGPVHDPEQLDL